MPNPREPDRSRQDILANLAKDFAPLRERLRRLEDSVNSQDLDLHFSSLPPIDQSVFDELVTLAEEGLRLTQEHDDHFHEHDLYDDRMFSYDLFLFTAAAAHRVYTSPQARDYLVDLQRLKGVIDSYEPYTNFGGDLTAPFREALRNLHSALQAALG